MKKKIIEFICFLLIILTIILMVISSIKITYSMMDLINYSNHLIFIGCISLIIYISLKFKNLRFNKYEIIIFILMLFSLLSLIYCRNLNAALFGNIGRYEGLFVIITYYLLFLISLNIKNKNYRKIIITMILLFGVINGIYGFMQVNILKIPWITLKGSWVYARGFFGNSMFYGTFMGICYSLVIGIFLKINSITKKIIIYFLLLFFTLGFIISGSMGAFVSIIIIFFLIIFEIIRMVLKNDKKNSLYQFISLILIILLLGVSYNVIVKRIPTLKNETQELFKESNSISSGVLEDNYGTGRIFIWKNTLIKIKENYLFGVGIDNFYYAFNPPLIDSVASKPVDKAHNEYLQKMLCEGILSGFIYIVFLLIIFFKSLFKEKNSLEYGLFLTFTYYSIQAFFNISITRIAPIFFIISGLLTLNDKKDIEI